MFPLAAYKQQRNSQMSHQKIPNPGIDRPRGSEIWRKDRAHVIHPYTDFATFQNEGSHVISGASGCYITDIEGNEYSLLDEILKNQKKLNGLIIEFHDCNLNKEKIYNFIKNSLFVYF